MKTTIFILILSLSLAFGDNPNWIDLSLSSTNGHLWLSTSELEKPAEFNEIGRYCVVNIFDGNPATCWADGVQGSGVGEKIYFSIPADLSALKITNGLAKNKQIFKKNNRIKKIKITLYGAVATDEDMGQFADNYKCLPYSKELTADLDDIISPQQIKLTFDWDSITTFKKHVLQAFETREDVQQNRSKRYFEYILQLEIMDVYKGSKWDDTCISEIEFIKNKNETMIVKKIYTNDDENSVFFDTNENSRIKLVEEKQSIFQIIDNSADKNWLILIRMPAEMEGRGETEYQLYYLPLKKNVDLKLMGYNVGNMYDFSQKDDHIYLNCADNGTLDDVKVDLNDVLKKIR
jgi:hypothetical protein